MANRLNPDTSLWHWLAHDLRLYRERAGMTLGLLGEHVGRSSSNLSNCEAGRRHIALKDARILDELWDTGGHFQRLLTFARLSHNPDWFQEHVSYEVKAEVIKIFETMYVPGVLQTEDYARAALTAGAYPDVEGGVAARTARQAILTKPEPPVLWAILDQAVLARPVGGAAVMREQLARLLDPGPTVSIRIVPWAAGEYIGQDGAFKVFSVPEGLSSLKRSEVAYAEAPTGGRLVLEPSEVRNFGLRYDRIGAKALPEDLSRGLIEAALEALG